MSLRGSASTEKGAGNAPLTNVRKTFYVIHYTTITGGVTS